MSNLAHNMRAQRMDAIWNVLGSLLYAGCQWGVLVATVKLSTAADVGRLSLGFAITAPIFLLLHLRLRAASATDAGLAFCAADYVWLRVLCTVLACLLTAVVCAASGMPKETVTVVLWIALAKAIESGSDLLYGLMQQADDLRTVALSMAARGVVSLALFAGVLAMTHRLDWALAGLCAGWAAVLITIDLPRTLARSEQRLLGGCKLSTLYKLTALTLPLGVSTMFMSLMANMPRYFIQHMMGLKELGIFSAAGYLTMTVSIIISAIAEASIARMARSFAAGERAEAAALLHRVLWITVALSGLSIAGSVLFGRMALRLVYRAEYGDAAVLLTGLMVAATMANLSSVYGYALIAARRFVRYLGCLAASAVFTAVLCALLIPRFGTEGAAAACVLGYGLQCVASWWMLRPDLVLEHAALADVRTATASL